jgi:hypothetical protein
MLVWLISGLLLLTSPGERLTVHVGYRFRRPSPDELAALEPVCARVLTQCGIDDARVDLYVQTATRLTRTR